MAPKAPDAHDGSSRDILLMYSMHHQCFEAWLETERQFEIKQVLIFRVRDHRVTDEFTADMETLKSWGVPIKMMPQVPNAYDFGIHHYRLHNTPRVRAILAKHDDSVRDRLNERFSELIGEAIAAGCELTQLSTIDDYTTWRPVVHQVQINKKTKGL